MLAYLTWVIRLFESAWYIYAKASPEDRAAYRIYQWAIAIGEALEVALNKPNVPPEVRGYVRFRLRASPWLQTAQ